MQTRLCVLLVEDAEDDALLLVRLLQRNGYALAWERVDTAVALAEALDRQPWDVVIADYNLPRFNGLVALQMVQARGLDMPFLLVSGAIGEEVAVNAMKAGANDYVMKDNLSRLVPALKRELREAAMRRERRAAEAELIRLSQAIEQGPGIVIITDANGAIEYVNARHEAVTGYTAAEVVGKNLRLLKAGAVPGERYARLWADLKAGKPWQGEFQDYTKSGEPFWASVSIAPVRDPDGRITHFLATEEEITLRKQAELALRQRTAELQARNEDLDAFAHTVAHDLKNPLSVLIGYADVLYADFPMLPDEQRRLFLDSIKVYGRKMKNIIDELLLLASVRQTEVVQDPLDMAAVVVNALDRHQDLVAELGAEIEQPARWPTSLGHAAWIEEVWVNYISNALRYGGRPPKIRLGATVQVDGQVCFWVQDNGPGIPPELHERLFRPFTQLSQIRTEGHGLGLSIVRRIVEKLNGRVGLSSDGVSGTTFFFTLPAAAGV